MQKYAVYRASGDSEIIELDTFINLEKLQELVNGSIEFYITAQGQQIYINEEGRILDLPSNPFFFEDIRGDVVEVGGTDDEGESVGVADDYVLRKATALPEELFVEGNKFTIFTLSNSMGATVSMEIKTKGYKGKDDKPVFTQRNKRKTATWVCNLGMLLIFRGWDLPVKTGMEVQVGRTRIATWDFMLTLGGLPEKELQEYILGKNINPFFIAHDHVKISDEYGVEKLLFPHASATSQRIADMQSEQLKDGITRMVIN